MVVSKGMGLDRHQESGAQVYRQAGRPGGSVQVSVLWFRVAFVFLGWYKSKLIEVLGFLNLKVFCYVN